MGYRQVVRHSTLTARYVGSNPTSPAPHTVDVDFDNDEQASYTVIRDVIVYKYKRCKQCIMTIGLMI